MQANVPVNIRMGSDFRERIKRLKRGGETYESVLKRIIDRAEEAGLDIEPTPEQDRARPVT